MRLLSYSVRGFQSYEDEQTVELEPHVTVIAGRNNVGKSALLRALHLPAGPPSPEGLVEAFRATYRWKVPRDDLLPALPTNMPGIEKLRAEADWTLRISLGSFQPGVQYRVHPFTELAFEELGAVATYGAGGVRWNGVLPENVGVEEIALFGRAHAENVIYIGPRQVFRGSQSLNAQGELESDARNLTQVLYHLQANYPMTTFARLQRVIKDAVPEIAGLSVALATDLGSTQGEPVVYYEGRLDQPIPLRHCGTGVEQLLALTVGILTTKTPTLFLIDEPQAYLHPHGERSLLALIEEHQQHQYVIATHSPFLLNAWPITQTRLVSMTGGRSLIMGPPEPAALLDELGVSAGDLWLADHILWVEGPSELAVLDVLMGRELSSTERAAIALRVMPDVSRFSGRSPTRAEATFRLCRTITEAITPLPVTMRFVFDRDEKDDEVLAEIRASSGDRAHFLPIRELENLFLHAGLLEIAIAARCAELDLTPPATGTVEQRLGAMLGDADDRELYRRRPRRGVGRNAIIRGSRVLDRLYYEFTQEQYDKVRDGRVLAELALEHAPHLLDPLREVVDAVRVAA